MADIFYVAVYVPVTLSDLERRVGKGETLSEDLRNYAPTV